MIYVIHGNPIALARPRFSQSRVFDSQKAEKLVASLTLARQHGDLPPFEDPIHIDMTFFMAIPKSMSKRKPPIDNKPHVFTPDLDNLIKFCGDVGTNAGIWNDDRIISSIAAKKLYDKDPRIEFIVKVL